MQWRNIGRITAEAAEQEPETERLFNRATRPLDAACVALFKRVDERMASREQPSSILAIYCDGLCEPRNPGGWACWGWLAKGPKGTIVRSAYGCLGHGVEMSNNLAEYEAVLQALRHTANQVALLRERNISVRVHADSQLVIRQITGEYRVNARHLMDLCREARDLESYIREQGVPIEFIWVPREQNQEADALSRRAYREARRVQKR